MFKRRITRMAIPACTALLIGGMFCSCSDDLLEGQPSWLGESIYDELDRRGNFKETLELIKAQDEDYASVLKKTGSKTLFVADDAAWARFYQSNPWGITSLASMTNAQKKLIFKGNMINSAYLVELLGNIPSVDASHDPEEGACMRRATSVDIMDSVPVVPASKFPGINPARVSLETGEIIDYWARLRGKSSALVLQDDNVASMIHFMPKFMQTNNVKDDDVNFLTNGEITTNTGAFVNGKVITEGDITCQNGYIHVLEDVSLPLDNMANVIANNPQFSIYNRLLQRFSYPHYDADATREYQRQNPGSTDSVYVKRFFNYGYTALDKTDDSDHAIYFKEIVGLPYDPGWNRYCLASANNSSYYQRDAAAILVPTDEAMKKYLLGEGSDLNERYANAGSGETAWDNAPDAVVLPLLQNTMLPSLKAAIPSQFASINNTSGESMGVKKSDVDSVLWACNGVIYQTNTVYVAPEYVSVYYPCVIRADEDLSLVYGVINKDNTTIGGEGFYAYLNSMGSSFKYSFIIPTDNALQTYYDPVSRYRKENGESTAVAYKFFLNSGVIDATPYLVDWSEGALDELGRGKIEDTPTNKVTLSKTFSKNGDVFNHFRDILNSSFSTGSFVPGQRFYLAKNGSPIVVEWGADNKVKGLAGSFQYERGYYIPVVESYDKSEKGNGISYIIDEEPLMSTFTSPYAAITDPLRKDRFGTFAELLVVDSTLIKTLDVTGSYVTPDKALSNLDNYNYTIYVPTNESVQELIDKHLLPTGEDLETVKACFEDMNPETEPEDYAYMEEQLQKMKDVISNFVNYHIQDNSIFVDGVAQSGTLYESACLDPRTTRFIKLRVNYSPGGQLTVTDNCGNVRTVASDCNNILARQYYFADTDGKGVKSMQSSENQQPCQIYSSSFVVIHQIDKPLVPFKVDEEYPNGSYYSPEDYDKVYAIIAAHPADGGTPTPNPIKRRIR